MELGLALARMLALQDHEAEDNKPHQQSADAA